VLAAACCDVLELRSICRSQPFTIGRQLGFESPRR
jgi:hypothetical protein